MSPVVRHEWPTGLRPVPGLVVAPLAQREQHRPAGLAQRFAHGEVRAFGLEAIGVAPVVLEIVDAPLRVGQRVLVFVAAAAGLAAAGFPAGIGIDAELQALRMHVVGQRFHAGGKVLGVGVDEAVRVAFAVPAVVDVHVLVAGVFHAARDHRVGGLADHLFVHVAGELVPAVPAHLRGLREAFELLRERDTRGQRAQHAAQDFPRECSFDFSQVSSLARRQRSKPDTQLSPKRPGCKIANHTFPGLEPAAYSCSGTNHVPLAAAIRPFRNDQMVRRSCLVAFGGVHRLDPHRAHARERRRHICSLYHVNAAYEANQAPGNATSRISSKTTWVCGVLRSHTAMRARAATPQSRRTHAPGPVRNHVVHDLVTGEGEARRKSRRCRPCRADAEMPTNHAGAAKPDRDPLPSRPPAMRASRSRTLLSGACNMPGKLFSRELIADVEKRLRRHSDERQPTPGTLEPAAALNLQQRHQQACATPNRRTSSRAAPGRRSR